MNMPHKTSKLEHAQGMLEFALVLPVLLLLVLGVIEGGRLLFIYSAVNTASREGVRYGSAAGDIGGGVPHYQDCSGIKAAAMRMGSLAGIKTSDISIRYDKGPGTAIVSATCPSSVTIGRGYRIEVQVNSQYKPILPIVPLSAFPITATTRRTILKDVAIEGSGSGSGTTPRVSFISVSEDRDESVALRKIVIRLSEPAYDDVSVQLNIGGSAKPGDDYTMLETSPIVFHPGEDTIELTVNVIDDSLYEFDETVEITMGTIINGLAGDITSYRLGIIDNDVPPTVSFTQSIQNIVEDTGYPDESVTAVLTVQLNAVSGRDTTVTYLLSGTATEGQDYAITPTTIMIPAGVTRQDIYVNIKYDDISEDDERVVVKLDSFTNADPDPDPAKIIHTVVILDNDIVYVAFILPDQKVSEAVGAVAVEVQLSSASSRDIAVGFQVGGTASSGGDYKITSPSSYVLTFPAGTKQASIQVELIGDSVTEPDETVIFTLQSPVNAQLGSPTVHTMTITNAPVVWFASESQYAMENASTMTVTVNLSPVLTQTVLVPFHLRADSTASLGKDYLISSSPLSIPAGKSSASITITMLDDTDYENDETIVIVMDDPVNAVKGPRTVHTATIKSDDLPPLVFFLSGGQSALESVGTMYATIALSGHSIQDVTVPYVIRSNSTAMPGNDYSISTPSPIIFPAGTLTQTININVVDDILYENDETVVIDLGTPVNGRIGSPIEHVATIKDNDLQTCSISTVNALDFENIKHGNEEDFWVGWKIQNTGLYPLTLKQARIVWPVVGPASSAPKVFTIQWGLNLGTGLAIWSGIPVAGGDFTNTNWLQLPSDRQLPAAPSNPMEITFNFSRLLDAGNYTVELIFHNDALNFDCSPISRSTALQP